jgi:hypothetical protein
VAAVRAACSPATRAADGRAVVAAAAAATKG